MTLLWTVLAPWIGMRLYWLLAGTILRSGSPGMSVWFIMFGYGCVTIYLILLIAWARRHLFNTLRESVSGAHTGTRGRAWLSFRVNHDMNSVKRLSLSRENPNPPE